MLDRLEEYDKRNKCSKSKGHLCVMIVVTRKAKELGFPIDPVSLLAKRKGQVLGLGKAAVQTVLNEYGIERVLAEEGGRTSRGSIDNMRRYVGLLNEFSAEKVLDLDAIEKYWIKRVQFFFAGKPFKLKLDPSKSLRAIIRDLLGQAMKRQKEMTGTMYVGAMMQHLVGAKLDYILPNGALEHHGFAVADGPTERPGDFIVESASVHVTASPGEALIRKCADNIEEDYRPIIVTVADRVGVAEGLAHDSGIGGRVDVFEIEQFLAVNIYEHSGFSTKRKRPTVEQIINKYNDLIDSCETDPSLKITLQR